MRIYGTTLLPLFFVISSAPRNTSSAFHMTLDLTERITGTLLSGNGQERGKENGVEI